MDSETFRKDEIVNDDSEENLDNYLKDITDDEGNDLDDDDENTSVEQGFDETKTVKTLDSYEKENNKEVLNSAIISVWNFWFSKNTNLSHLSALTVY